MGFRMWLAALWLLSGFGIAFAQEQNGEPGGHAPADRFGFAEAGFIELAVGEVALRTATGQAGNAQPPGEAPAPAILAEDWVINRVRPVGTADRLQANIMRASLIETDLREDGGSALSIVRDEPDRRYDAALVVALDYTDQRPGGRSVRVEVTVTGSVTIGSKANLEEAEASYRAMLDAMARDLNARLEERFARDLAFLVEGDV